MDLTAAKPAPGRHLGWSESDIATHPYSHHWNPVMGDLPPHVLQALAHSPYAPPLLPSMDEAITDIVGAPIQNGFSITPRGAIHVNVMTELPGVTPEMVDWWFGWHSDSPERYKLWHPRAHVHAQWSAAPPEGSRGRDRYVGQTSIVDEYVGSRLGRFAIAFRTPASVGLSDDTVGVGVDATAVCARVGLADVPVDAGWLAHLVSRVEGGSVMRSRFWIGLPYLAPRVSALRLATPLLRVAARPTEADARALLVHCAQEMAHLATFLPALHSEQAG